MTTELVPDVGEIIAAIGVLLAAFCGGGVAGLYIAWSQPARMDRYAVEVCDRIQRRLNKAEGFDTDDMVDGGAWAAWPVDGARDGVPAGGPRG